MGLCDFGKLLNANDYDMREWFMISGFGQLMFIIAYYYDDCCSAFIFSFIIFIEMLWMRGLSPGQLADIYFHKGYMNTSELDLEYL